MREATEAVAILLSLVAPYTAEEMWERLGHQPTVARAGWPVVDEALLVQESVTAVVQIQGKVRARLEVSPDISEDDLEAAALADETVRRALDGRTVRKVIVRAPEAGQHRRRVSGCAACPQRVGCVAQVLPGQDQVEPGPGHPDRRHLHVERQVLEGQVDAEDLAERGADVGREVLAAADLRAGEGQRVGGDSRLDRDRGPEGLAEERELLAGGDPAVATEPAP